MRELPVPGFSIIIPTHRRAGMVECLLASLGRARASFGGDTEVLVLDSSPPADAESIRQSCLRWQAEYEVTENDVCRKRNKGVERSRCELVFFIDSDCEAEPDVLSYHWRSHQTGESDVVGVTGLTRWTGLEGTAWRVLKHYPSMTAAFSLAAWLQEVDWATCTNLSIRREALLEIGGFSEKFPLHVYGEDVDLGLRLRRLGYRIRCNPDAVVLHHREALSTLRALLRKAFLTGRADFHLGELHPDRLTLEFPLPVATTFLLLAAAGAHVVVHGDRILLTAPPVWLAFFVLFQAALASAMEERRASTLPFRMAAALLECAFELGRLFEALPRLQLRRLWTKFVYVKEQLAAERPRRIAQMWSLLASLLLVLLLFL